VNWTSGNLTNGVATIVAVLAETFRDDVAAYHQKHKEGEDEESPKSKKMSCIFEDAHRVSLLDAANRRFNEAGSCDPDHSIT